MLFVNCLKKVEKIKADFDGKLTGFVKKLKNIPQKKTPTLKE
jgi:hypothetical protein